MTSETLEKSINCIVELTLPSWPKILPNEYSQVIDGISYFVINKIKNMDRFFRIPYFALLYIFIFLPIMFYVRPFYKLPLITKKNYVARWQNHVISPCRDFLKLISSLVVLAFYDHHIIQDSMGINISKKDKK